MGTFLLQHAIARYDVSGGKSKSFQAEIKYVQIQSHRKVSTRHNLVLKQYIDKNYNRSKLIHTFLLWKSNVYPELYIRMLVCKIKPYPS